MARNAAGRTKTSGVANGIAQVHDAVAEAEFVDQRQLEGR
jgi:hypothetical protein